ncbi:hypothetical protein [Nostoc sp.]|uniref:hypothetical protein n=1 Tax=Nostoc sp. TaxID=1180 RepID=UPI002FF6755A
MRSINWRGQTLNFLECDALLYERLRQRQAQGKTYGGLHAYGKAILQGFTFFIVSLES